ncbi:hypothetical protein [Thermaurantiacus tibetensis]|uniref:hypothetical protein n=1 Tax=Thermaurantiacus tibetensis TaxID=2759035 RepID=UPI00188F9091|nr:hypothetical protein [Thermaurantiacus tibetensis]
MGDNLEPNPGQNLFDVASDEVLAQMIAGARHRILMVAPALTASVAQALVGRLDEPQSPLIELILDADPEVYRLGFGDVAALALIRDRMLAHGLAVRQQEGIRIGVLVTDEAMIVWSPTPRLVEAGSTSRQKPNAIRLGGTAAAQKLAEAVGAGDGPPEVGKVGLTPEKAEEVANDLRRNPPQKFDLARAVRVFSSQARYVELEVRNSRFASRSVPWPEELLGIIDEKLRKRVEGRFKPFADFDLRLPVNVVHPDGREREVRIDEKWLNQQRQSLENWTFEVKGYGRIILRQHQDAFEKGVERLKTNLNRYRSALQNAMDARKAEIVQQVIAEFRPRWLASPPPERMRWGRPSDAELEAELAWIAAQLVDDATCFDEPETKVVIKDIAPESVQSEEFVSRLEQAMRKARVPDSIIENLWKTYMAARQAD